MEFNLQQETLMKCPICRSGELQAGFITVTLERGTSIIVFRGVPADVCDTCGEEYLSAERNRELLGRAEDVVARGVELELLSYAA